VVADPSPRKSASIKSCAFSGSESSLLFSCRPMGAYEAAKDFAKSAITAGLSVDMIQLLEKKRDLLLDEVGDLQKAKATLESENKALKEQSSRSPAKA